MLALFIGGIRVDWRGAGLVAGAAITLALWHAATDRELGSKFSETQAIRRIENDVSSNRRALRRIAMKGCNNEDHAWLKSPIKIPFR